MNTYAHLLFLNRLFFQFFALFFLLTLKKASLYNTNPQRTLEKSDKN